MFRAFLKVADHCPACGEALHHQRADDAPAYFVILIVGHIVVPIALCGRDWRSRRPTGCTPRMWLPLTLGAFARSAAADEGRASSVCNGRCACTASIRREADHDELAPSRIVEPRR